MAIEYPSYRSHTRLFVLSGPSGSSKSTMIHNALEHESNCVMSISTTTRAPRGQEVDGIDYNFTDEATFKGMIERGEFLEYAQVFGKHYYGTPKAFIEEQFALGNNVIMDIDVQGAVQIREQMPADAVLIFVTPPTHDELERRLRSRGTEEEGAIISRLDEADREIASWKTYDYLIINDQLDKAVLQLRHILATARLRIDW